MARKTSSSRSGGWFGPVLIAAAVLAGLLYLHYAHGLNAPDLSHLPHVPKLSQLGS